MTFKFIGRKLAVFALILTMFASFAGCVSSDRENKDNNSKTAAGQNDRRNESEKGQTFDTDSLASIKYYGDISKCKMTGEMADAYIEAINEAAKTKGIDNTYAVLMDLAGDGIPIMLTAAAGGHVSDGRADSADFRIWTWDGKSAEVYDFAKDGHPYSWAYTFAAWPDHGEITITDEMGAYEGEAPITVYYDVSGGQLTLRAEEIHYTADVIGDTAYASVMPGDDTLGEYINPVSELLDEGWIGEKDEDGNYTILFTDYINGVQYTYGSYEDYMRKLEQDAKESNMAEFYNIYARGNGGEWIKLSDWSPGEDMISALEGSSDSDKEASAEITAEEAFANVKYYGDISKCKMPKEMIKAYIDTLETHINNTQSEVDGNYEIFPKAVLMDIAGDGMPLLLTGKSIMESFYNGDVSIWSWDGNKAYKNPFANESYLWEKSYGFYPDGYDEMIIMSGGNTAGSIRESFVTYKVSDTVLTVVNEYVCYWLDVNDDGTTVYADKDFGISTATGSNGKYTIPKADLINAGWLEYSPDYGNYLVAVYRNGKIENHLSYSELLSVRSDIYRAHMEREGYDICGSSTEGISVIDSYWSDAEDILSALESYCKSGKKSKVKVELKNPEYDNINYIEEIFKSMNGNAPDDSSNIDISNYITAYVTKNSKCNLKSKDNIITVTGSDIEDAVSDAADAMDEMTGLCDKYEIVLNKEPDCNIRYVCTDADNSKTVKLVFDKDAADSADGCSELRFVLGDDEHCVCIDSEAFKALCDKYGKWSIEITPASGGEFEIVFLDEKGGRIEQLDCGEVGFALPSKGDYYTVMYDGRNWGGSYISGTDTIEFATAYSGTYSVELKDVKINDISDLTKEEQEAIKFITSREFMSLEDGDFRPDEDAVRYEFAEAFVRIFCKYDENAVTEFSDVKKGTYYYPYVASGEELGIIKGYPEDNTFRGEEVVSREEAIAFCSRILMDKKGYNPPENPAEYLNFEDNSSIEWGHEEIALAVREGLVDAGGILNPKDDITRKEAAELLYRLYKLLSDEDVTVATADAAVAAPPSKGGIASNKPLVIGLVSGAIVLAGTIIGLITMLLKRNKAVPKIKEPSESPESTDDE